MFECGVRAVAVVDNENKNRRIVIEECTDRGPRGLNHEKAST